MVIDYRRAAGIPEEVEFITKPRQAQAMIAQEAAARVPFAWLTADETYGQAKWLQAWLEDQDIWHVMAIRRSDTLTTPAGQQQADDHRRRRAAVLAADLGRGRGARRARVRLGAEEGSLK